MTDATNITGNNQHIYNSMCGHVMDIPYHDNMDKVRWCAS